MLNASYRSQFRGITSKELQISTEELEQYAQSKDGLTLPCMALLCRAVLQGGYVQASDREALARVHEKQPEVGLQPPHRTVNPIHVQLWSPLLKRR